jgi:microcystin-dependent protein
MPGATRGAAVPQTPTSGPDAPAPSQDSGGVRRLTAALLGLNAVAVLALVVLVGTAALQPTIFSRGLAPRPAGPGPALPDGAVVAVLADACPYPWRPFAPAEGRFVIGAATGGTPSADAAGTLLAARAPGTTGGLAAVELAPADVPSHTHRLRAVGASPGAEGVPFVQVDEAGPVAAILVPFGGKRPRERIVDVLEPSGGVIATDGRRRARAHDNVPPFVALTHCIYTADLPLQPAEARR